MKNALLSKGCHVRRRRVSDLLGSTEAVALSRLVQYHKARLSSSRQHLLRSYCRYPSYQVDSMSYVFGRFIAFGVALDPRQQVLFGMFAGPLAVGCALGLVSFASAGLVPGYNGASMNPARCFAFAIARRSFLGKLLK